jgi:hypothetical protein
VVIESERGRRAGVLDDRAPRKSDWNGRGESKQRERERWMFDREGQVLNEVDDDENTFRMPRRQTNASEEEEAVDHLIWV